MSSDHVELRVPASGAYVSVLRTAVAGLAARLDFTVDDIEDLRIAVDEACAVLLPLAVADARLSAQFDLEPGRLQVAVSVPSNATQPPSRNTFAWTVLTALVGEVDASIDDGRLTLTLRKQQAVNQG
ncbi:MAG TPA: anti-sigma regulatory factor [Jiangellaceae bacterium]|jgi:serine/threonine-protein kinase RsbW|nr:anti-sigma regulatory factor [Jiangellaceae bacterium]